MFRVRIRYYNKLLNCHLDTTSQQSFKCPAIPPTSYVFKSMNAMHLFSSREKQIRHKFIHCDIVATAPLLTVFPLLSALPSIKLDQIQELRKDNYFLLQQLPSTFRDVIQCICQNHSLSWREAEISAQVEKKSGERDWSCQGRKVIPWLVRHGLLLLIFLFYDWPTKQG